MTEDRPSDLPIVFTNGCFDILHRGHIELLNYCFELGQVIVGLNSDDSVQRLKGKSRPINSQQDRKKVLESVKFVSKVIVFDEPTPYELISEIRPMYIVKGGDYNAEDVVGHDLAEVRIFPLVKDHSTTNLIFKMSTLEEV